jgi:hypothetical protein
MHIIASLVVLAGIGLLELEVLPRIGYARTTGVWSCSDKPAEALPAAK